MARDHLDELRELVRRRTGVDLKATRHRGSLEPFIGRRVRALGFTDRRSYIKLLESEASTGPELTRLIAVVTNPHTFFFRDHAQFAAASSIARRQRPSVVWSAGCSTGEEPYTVAMILASLGIDARVVASDINAEVLEIAREGAYGSWALRRCPESIRERFFVRDGDDGFRVSDEIRRMVTFKRHNLVEDAPLLPEGADSWDWLFCRNVLLYFDRPTTALVLGRFASVLRPQSWLFLSTAEHVRGLEPAFRMASVESSFAYQRLGEAPMVESGVPSPPPPPLRPSMTKRRMVKTPWPRELAFHHAARRRDSSVPPSIEDPMQRVAHAIAAGELEDARTELARHLEQRPDDAVAWTSQGNVSLRLHDFDGALSCYEKARSFDALSSEIYYLQGVVYRKLGDIQRAAHVLRQALFLDPTFWSASFLLAGLHARMGDERGRRRNLELTLELLERGVDDVRFSSLVEGMNDVRLDPVRTEALCRRYLEKPPL